MNEKKLIVAEIQREHDFKLKNKIISQQIMFTLAPSWLSKCAAAEIITLTAGRTERAEEALLSNILSASIRETTRIVGSGLVEFEPSGTVVFRVRRARFTPPSSSQNEDVN